MRIVLELSSIPQAFLAFECTECRDSHRRLHRLTGGSLFNSDDVLLQRVMFFPQRYGHSRALGRTTISRCNLAEISLRKNVFLS